MTEKLEEVKEKANNAARIARTTMVGDLRDLVIQILKDPKFTGKAWQDMKETEQKDVTHKIVSRVESSVIRAVDVIRASGQPNIKALIKQVTVKDGVKIALECSKAHERLHELVDAQGDHVLLVLTDEEEYVGERAPVEYDKDEPELPIDEEEGEGETDETEVENESDAEEETSVEEGDLERDAAQYT